MATKSDDALEESKALKRLLTSMAQNYYEGDDGPVEVEWAEGISAAGLNGDTPVAEINVDAPWDVFEATGPHALRILVDIVGHEVEHHNRSEIMGKHEFMERHDDGYAQLAGMVINVLEDVHIDHQRYKRYRGLKRIDEWETQKLMEGHDAMGDLEPRDQAIAGFMQLAISGKIKGASDLDPDVASALQDVSHHVEQVKMEHDPEAREEIAEDVLKRLKDVIPKKPDLPDWLKEAIEDLLEQLEQTDFEPGEAPDDVNFDPEDAEEAEAGEDGEAAEEGEEVEDDGDSPAHGSHESEGGDDQDGNGRTTHRRVADLTGGRSDAENIRIVK